MSKYPVINIRKDVIECMEMIKTKSKNMILIMMVLSLFAASITGCGAPRENSDGEADNAKTTLVSELTEIVGEIYEITGIDQEIAIETTPVDLANPDSIMYNMGLEDGSVIKEAVVSESLVSSQAYSLVLARVNNVAEIESVAKNMKDGIDQQKWICVVADDIKVVTYDDVILLIMVSSTMEDVATSKKVTDAFKEVCDADFDIAL